MYSKDIEHSIRRIFENFSQDEFIFDFLVVYGISKTSVTRLKKGDFNLSKVQGEVLYKKKLLFKEEKSDKLLISIESLSAEERILVSHRSTPSAKHLHYRDAIVFRSSQ